jgi:hypothetical protein
MNQKNWGYFSSLAKRCILAGLVGTISSGCMSIDTNRNRSLSEAENSTNIDNSSKDVRVDNSQNIDIKGNDVSVSSKTSTTMTARTEE